MKLITEEWLRRARDDLSGKPSVQDAKQLYEFANDLYHDVKKFLENGNTTPGKTNEPLPR